MRAGPRAKPARYRAVTEALITDILVVLSAAVAAALIFEKAKLPTLLGFIVAGTLIGPSGLGILQNIDRIRWIAELGMVFLLFAIGLEFSFAKIRGIGRFAFVGGFCQIGLTIGVVTAVALWAGLTAAQGLVIGFAVALSSTAVVLRHLMERAEADTQHGRIAVAILIFQDIAVAPFLAFLPLLTAGSGGQASMGPIAVKAVLFFGGVGLLSSGVLSRMIRRIALTRSREILLLAILAFSFGTASISQAVGLSKPLGAFLAGVLIANTDYRHQIGNDIAPFRQVLVSIFFVSLGLLFDVRFFASHAAMVMGLAAASLALNMVIVSGIVLAFGYSPRVALTTGLLLAQIGEFSFLFLNAAKFYGIIGEFVHATLFTSAVITLFASPIFFRLVAPIGRWTQKHAVLGLHPAEKSRSDNRELKNHVVICGFGHTGRDLAGSLKEEGIPLIVIEMNPHHLEAAKALGYEALYGDAANQEALKRAGADKARAIVVSFGDSSSLERIALAAQEMNRDALLIVRTRFERDAASLYEAGADGVVIEEIEASMELTRLVLTRLAFDEERIKKHETVIRNRKELLIEHGILLKFSKDSG